MTTIPEGVRAEGGITVAGRSFSRRSSAVSAAVAEGAASAEAVSAVSAVSAAAWVAAVVPDVRSDYRTVCSFVNLKPGLLLSLPPKNGRSQQERRPLRIMAWQEESSRAKCTKKKCLQPVSRCRRPRTLTDGSRQNATLSGCFRSVTFPRWRAGRNRSGRRTAILAAYAPQLCLRWLRPGKGRHGRSESAVFEGRHANGRLSAGSLLAFLPIQESKCHHDMSGKSRRVRRTNKRTIKT